MADDAPGGNPFEAIRHTREDGAEYWLARELGPELGYTRWENFHTAIKRAMTACETSGQAVSDHFHASVKLIEAAKSAKRELQDYQLSRYACYLIAMNGDPSKPVIAAAQTYFAVQTRRAEVADQIDARRAHYRRLGYADDWIDRRLQSLVVRDELTAEWHQRGAHGRDFAALTDTLSTGTFSLTTSQHKDVKHLGAKANLRDSMTGLELALTTLAEETAKAMHQARDSQGINELQTDAQEAGEVGGAARRDIEERIGESVISPTNYKALRQQRVKQLQPPLFADDDTGGDGEDE